jgi:hypothetical protein
MQRYLSRIFPNPHPQEFSANPSQSVIILYHRQILRNIFKRRYELGALLEETIGDLQ